MRIISQSEESDIEVRIIEVLTTDEDYFSPNQKDNHMLLTEN